MKRINDMFMRFKGIPNYAVGAKLIGMPTRQISVQRGSKETIPGRDGYLFVSSGYQEITVKQDIAVTDNLYLGQVKSWLSGSGDLVFGDFPDYAYEAQVISAPSMQSISKRLQGQKITVTFTCQPFMHLVLEEQIVLTQGKVFNGLGDVNSMPLVKVEGSGSGTLIINNKTMNLTLVDGTPLYIDCDAATAYTMNGSTVEYAGNDIVLVDDWYELYPASTDVSEWNNINFNDAITKVTITPRWRFL